MAPVQGSRPTRGAHLFYTLCLVFFILSQVSAQDCSASNPCATGCCSTAGYCGTGDQYCSADNCVANCDSTAEAQCSATKPCAEGCCSKFGICGYGPDYCSEDKCVSTCNRKSECDPKNWGSDFAESTTCPLNVCCSDYGFCGTTKEFCGNSKSVGRVIGYYEGWATTRSCHAFWPEQIPSGVYTHLNYAFATVDPDTYEVIPPSQNEGDLMKRLTALKESDPLLSVNIAIGGWDFNDPGPTASIFSDMAASEENQKKFFKSLTSFMSTYGFDGVDIDWEYPQDTGRGGQDEDFSNFPKFMKNLKSALDGIGGNGDLSLTLPTSYWYLRHFDLKALDKSVDYFNYMSYDLHGTWDRGKWTGEFLDAHTNLTEIQDAMNLLWRNDISGDNVNLGIVFYSRAFTVIDKNCMTPGCLFASGALPGPCSAQTGILLNSELDDIRSNKSIEPKLDKTAAVELLQWSDQWASYDDEDTFKLKIDFAQKSCLGGVMVWAVSHDTADGKYSNALAGVAPQSKPMVLLEVDDDDVITTTSKVSQCKWSKCGEVCSGDYVAVSRSDPGYREGELMIDSRVCEDGLLHTLCCPKEDVPKCGWYKHNGGKCTSTCPSDMFEIGSTTSACRSGYQAACCEKGKDSTKLYVDLLQWSDHQPNNCKLGKCPVDGGSKSDIMVEASAGSGDAMCWADDINIWKNTVGFPGRKLCYDSDVSDESWDDCDWYTSIGDIPDGESDQWCANGCPADKIRLASGMPDKNNDCEGGRRAWCCSPNYSVTKTKVNPEMQEFRDALNNYRVDGICPTGQDESPVTRRDFLTANYRPRQNGTLARRDDITSTKKLDFAIGVLMPLISKPALELSSKETKEAEDWDDWAKKNNFPGLELKLLQPYVTSLRYFWEMGARSTAQNILCRLDFWSASTTTTEEDENDDAFCLGDPCDDDADPTLCMQEQYDMDGDDDSEDPDVSTRDLNFFEKRATAKSYSLFCDGTQLDSRLLKIKPVAYPSAGKWKSTDKVFTAARTYQDPNDCSNPLIDPISKTGNNHDTEHILELQMIGEFFKWATKGSLPSGNPASFTKLDCRYFLPANVPLAGNTVSVLGSLFKDSDGLGPIHQSIYTGDPFNDGQTPAFRIMAALGTTKNRKNFYLLQKAVNGMKARIFGNKQLVDSTKWKTFVDNTSKPGIALKEIKAAIAVWHYLNDKDVKESFVSIVSDLRDILQAIDDDQFKPSDLTGSLVDAWDEFWPDWVDMQLERSKTWISSAINDMKVKWASVQGKARLKTIVLANLIELEGYRSAIVQFDSDIFT